MPAKTYHDKPVAKWNTNNFIDYLTDEHKRLYGTDYLPPGRRWIAERGLIGNIIGTKGKNAKPQKYPPEMLKRFIDECYRTHNLNGYSGVNFTFFWTYRTELWRRMQLEALNKENDEKAIKSSDSLDDVSDWL
jgi:hypothetical protein